MSLGNRVASQTASRFVGKAVGTYIRWGLFFFFLLFIILNAAVVAIEGKDFGLFLEDIGSRIAGPTNELLEMSKDISENGIYSANSGNVLLDFFLMIKNYILLFASIYAIYWWIFVFYKLMSIFDTSRVFSNTITAIITFLVFQALYIAYFVSVKDIMIPFLALYEFIKIVPILLDPFREAVMEVAPEVNITNSS